MGDLKILLFEEPLALYLLFGFALLVTLVRLYLRRTRGALIAVLVPVALAGLVAILAAAVTTERERLIAAMHGLVGAAKDRNAEQMSLWMDETYADGRYSRRALIAAAMRMRDVLGVRAVRLSQLEIEIDGAEATVDFMAVVHMENSQIGRDVLPTRWRMWWARRTERWRLTSARMDEPENVSVAPQGPGKRTPG